MKSLSNKRLIVEGEINGKKEIFLLDTGATVALIDKNYPGLSLGKKFKVPLIGAGGNVKSLYYCNTPVKINNKDILQFITADISNIQDSIEDLTGYRITGIISLPQMQFLGLKINLLTNEIF